MRSPISTICFQASYHNHYIMQYESQTRGLMQKLLHLELLLVYNAFGAWKTICWTPERDNPIDDFFLQGARQSMWNAITNSQHDNPTSKVDSCSLLCCLLLICNFHSILFCCYVCANVFCSDCVLVIVYLYFPIILDLHILLAAVVIPP